LESPVKNKYGRDEKMILRRLVLTQDPIFNTADGLRKLLAQPPFSDVQRSLVSIRTKIRDIKKSINKM